MTSKLKTDVLETGSGSGTIALNNQLSGMTHASVPTLTTGHIPTLTETHLPVGSVVQVVQTYTPSASGATSSTSFYATGIIASITPKFNNSLILVSFSSTMGYIPASAGQASMFMNNGGAGYAAMAGGSHYHVGYISSTNIYAPLVFNGQYLATSLNTLDFQLYAKTGNASYAFQYSHSASSRALTLTEIKQ